MVHEKLAVAVPPLPSATVTITLLAPMVVGVPLITPVAAAMLMPAGRPVAENVKGLPSRSVADIAKVCAVPFVPVCAAGVVIVGGLLAAVTIAQLNVADAVPPLPSTTVTITLLAS